MNSKITLGFILTGVIILVASMFLPHRSFDFLGTSAIAKVTLIKSEIKNGALTQGLDQYDQIPLVVGNKIKPLDMIKTNSSTEVVLKFLDHPTKIRIYENSEIIFEKLEQNSLLINIKYGDILFESIDPKAPLWVRKSSEQTTATDYAYSNIKNLEYLRQHGFKIQRSEDQSLSQAKIEEIIASKKNDLFRCYGQLIQKEEHAQGQVLVSFEIAPNGKVIKVDINKTEITDHSFKMCITEVIARTRFPSFEGSSLTTVFPLRFD